MQGGEDGARRSAAEAAAKLFIARVFDTAAAAGRGELRDAELRAALDGHVAALMASLFPEQRGG
jgi:hypothetical protein